MLEQIVRPFQSPVVIGTRRIIANNTQVAVTQAQLRWGEAGSLPSATEEVEDDPSVGFKVKNDNETLKEKNRVVDTIEVPNNAGPGSVTVERIKSITFSKTSDVGSTNAATQNQTTSFAGPDPFAGTPNNTTAVSGTSQSTFNLKNDH